MIPYMGTKHELAEPVRQVIDRAQPGMILDAFAGMGAVARAVSPSRKVWVNDVQRFAHLAGRVAFTSTRPSPSAAAFVDLVEDELNHTALVYSRS